METNQAPAAVPSLSFYNNNYHNYAGYGLPHPHAYCGYPGWSPMLSASAPSSVPAPMSASMTLSPSWFGWPSPIPVATSTPLNPAFVYSTSSQINSSMMNVQREASGNFSVSGQNGSEQSLTKGTWGTTAVGNTGTGTRMDLSNYWTSISMENQSNDKNGSPSSWATSTADPQMPIFTPMQKVPITPKPQFGTPHPPMFYPHPFGHPIQYPFPPYSTGYYPMPTSQQNQVQPIIKDIEKEIPKEAKDGIYRNCLVCGDQNIKCGKYTGLQACYSCKRFFKLMVEFGNDKKATFQCTHGPGNCLINKETRNSCEFCRFQACLKARMDRQKIVELKAKREKNKGDPVMTID